MRKGPNSYDRRVGFERKSDGVRNELNEVVSEFVLMGQTYARRSDVRDMEKVNAGREMSALMSRFIVRSSDLTRSLKASDQLVLSGSWDARGIRQSGQVWDIDGIKEVPGRTHDEIEITGILSRENQA